MYRFLSNSRSPKPDRQIGQLTAEEISQSKVALWRLQQRRYYPKEYDRLQAGKPLNRDSAILKLSPYLDKSSGLLRVTGRLHNAQLSFNQKHPIILPPNHISLLLTRAYHLFYNHAGVDSTLAQIRDDFLIIKGRRAAKTVVKYCIPCQKIDSRPCNQIAPPLPGFRVIPNRPFNSVGIEYAGPLH